MGMGRGVPSQLKPICSSPVSLPLPESYSKGTLIAETLGRWPEYEREMHAQTISEISELLLFWDLYCRTSQADREIQVMYQYTGKGVNWTSGFLSPPIVQTHKENQGCVERIVWWQWKKCGISFLQRGTDGVDHQNVTTIYPLVGFRATAFSSPCTTLPSLLLSQPCPFTAASRRK